MSKLKDALNLTLFLLVIWLLLSGHYTPLLLIFGVFSVLLAVFLAMRAELLDHVIQPILIKPSVIFYWLWLGREILKSNIDVARRILDPRMPISPRVFTVHADQKTDLGRVTYANSITLVPGTVTMNVDGNTFTVHALTRKAMEDLKSGEMNRRVCNVERVF